MDRNSDDQHSVCDAEDDPVRDYCKICPNVQLTSADNVQDTDESSRTSKFVKKYKNSSDSARLQNFGDFTFEVRDKWKRWATRMVVLCTE